MNCPSCSAQNREGRRFCARCAAPLAVSCPTCGYLNEPEERFCGGCAASLAWVPTATDVDRSSRDAARSAERRQLTVMFCDLVGFTELAGHLDAEELREVVRAYHEVCTDAINGFEGHVAQYLGDGLLVYFGYPFAHEDDARRAVHAGLAIVDAVRTLDGVLRTRRGITLSVRVGLHTGTVVVGEIGAGGRSERLALGETPNLASRIQAVAPPNSVVMSDVTHRLVEGLFASRDLGLHALKGTSTSLRLHQVLGGDGARHRLDVATARLTPLVGRETEIELLLERWQKAREGQGQVVLLSGEAGIGKSRLLRVVKERIGEESRIWLECRGSAYHQHSAFYPIVELLERIAGITRHDSGEAKFAKLETELTPVMSAQDDVPLYAALLSLPLPDRYPPLALSSQRQKQKTLEALLGGLLSRARQRPVLLVVEDLQWVDPSTLQLIELVMDHIATAPVLAVLTFRPEFRPPWPPRDEHRHLALNRLTRPQTERMVMRLTDGKSLPAELLHQVVAKTDGIPLFVEELTKMVLESGWLKDQDDHYGLAGPLPQLAIPTTLQASLTARLDRLGAAKEVAQLGATLGRTFSYELVQAAGTLDAIDLQERLAQLVAAELLHQRGELPHTSYVFKHALVQDAAYDSLLRSKRQEYHRRIAETLASQFDDIATTQPELVAHHYTEADARPQAIMFWQRAGRRASQRSAHVEAIRHLRKGLELLRTLPDSRDRAQHELALLGTLGVSLLSTQGYAALEVETVYTRARALCEQLGDTRRLVPVLMGLLAFYLVRADMGTARRLGEQLLASAETTGDPMHLLNGHYTLAHVLFFQGELGPTRTHAAQGVAVYDAAKHSPHTTGAGQDPAVSCLSYASLASWMLGYPDQALRQSEEALAIAQRLSHTFSRAYALGIAAMFRQCRGDVGVVEEQAEAMIVLCREQDFTFHLGWATILRAWTIVEHGRVEEGLDQMRHGLGIFESTGAEVLRPYWLALQADAHRRLGQTAEGLATLEEALEKATRHGERFYEAELHRLTGELLLAAGSDDAAEVSFLRAIEVAREQEARSLELRAVVSLVRCSRRRGQTIETRRQLAELYGWFGEGFETTDLQAARRLLAEPA